MACGVGDTLVQNTLLLQVHGAKTALPESDLVRGIHFGFERTAEQDPKYPIRLLVDIAIKALSAAINDPTTAVQAIDQIEDLLRRLGARDLDAGYAHDAAGNLRLIFPMPTWEDYLVLSFDEIRHYGAGSVQVMRRLRSALVGLADSVTDDTRIGGGGAVSQATRFDCRKLNSHCGRPGNGAPGGPARPRPAAQTIESRKNTLVPPLNGWSITSPTKRTARHCAAIGPTVRHACAVKSK